MSETIKAWSHSALGVFEGCPHRAKLARIDKIPEPDRGPPPAKFKGEWPNDRGTRVHDYAEQYIRGNEDVQLPEMDKFSVEFENLRERYKDGKVILEDMWCFNDGWSSVAPNDYENIWVRIKLDAFVFLSDTEGVVIDFKTGKRYGNEVKHAEQCQLYQLAAFLRYPQLELVHTELWYLDQDELAYMKFTRFQGERFLKGFNERGLKMTSATEFPAKPSSFTCKWCPYGPANSGHCKVGIQ